MDRLTFTGQVTFVVSRRSRALFADRISRNNTRWVTYDPPQFATGRGARSVGVMDFFCNIQKNARGGERSAVEASVIRHVQALAGGEGGVSLRDMIVWVDDQFEALDRFPEADEPEANLDEMTGWPMGSPILTTEIADANA